YSDELGSAAFYYHLLNAGFTLPTTGGTDNFSDVWRDPPPGSDRTFAWIDGPLSVRSWLDAVKRGRTFTATGPLIFIDVDGHKPGDEIAVAATAPRTVHVKAEVLSITPVDSLQIIVNGEVAQSIPAADKAHVTFDGAVEMLEGGWIAAR